MLFPLNYRQLARMSHNLAVCLDAGVPLVQAFRTSTQSLAARDSAAWAQVIARLENGAPLSEALRVLAWRLPKFYLTLIAAGERTGRLEEVLRLIAHQCDVLARPMQAVRNAWLGPLILYLAATPLQLLLVISLGLWSRVLHVLLDGIGQIGSVAAIAILVWAPPLKPAWDRLRLFMPVWGAAERELAISRFLRVLGMFYATGGIRVEQMIRLSADCVSNDHIRSDLRQAARRVERGANLTEALGACTTIYPAEHETLATGDLTGTLERACEHVANQLDELIVTRMKVITWFAVRVMFALVSLSAVGILSTLLSGFLLRQ